MGERSTQARFHQASADICTAWLDAYSGDRSFWVEYGVGRRACAWIDAIRQQEPAAISSQTNLRGTLDHILAALIALGVPEARRLELELAKL